MQLAEHLMALRLTYQFQFQPAWSCLIWSWLWPRTSLYMMMLLMLHCCFFCRLLPHHIDRSSTRTETYLPVFIDEKHITMNTVNWRNNPRCTVLDCIHTPVYRFQVIHSVHCSIGQIRETRHVHSEFSATEDPGNSRIYLISLTSLTRVTKSNLFHQHEYYTAVIVYTVVALTT